MPESFDPNQYEYHYKQEERIASQSRWMKEMKLPKTFFQRNRNLLIILFDIALVLIVFMIFSPYANLGKPVLAGYLLQGKAFYFDDEILVSVTAAPQKDSGPSEVLLEFSPSRDFDAQAPVLRNILSPEGEKTFRMSLDAGTEPDDLPGHIYVRVSIAGGERILKIPLERESGR